MSRGIRHVGDKLILELEQVREAFFEAEMCACCRSTAH